LNLMRGERAGWKNDYTQQELVRGEAHGGPQALEARDFVRRTLNRFDQETQAAVIHYYVDEMTLEEVSVLLDRSVPTIRKRLRAYADSTGQELREP
jgi:RNA polymerase sigma-70 factor (ECF subfamily)